MSTALLKNANAGLPSILLLLCCLCLPCAVNTVQAGAPRVERATLLPDSAAVEAAPRTLADDEPEAEKPERCRSCIRAKIIWALGVVAVLFVGIFVL